MGVRGVSVLERIGRRSERGGEGRWAVGVWISIVIAVVDGRIGARGSAGDRKRDSHGGRYGGIRWCCWRWRAGFLLVTVWLRRRERGGWQRGKRHSEYDV